MQMLISEQNNITGRELNLYHWIVNHLLRNYSAIEYGNRKGTIEDLFCANLS